MRKNGTTENGIGVTVPITPAADRTSFNVTIKAQTLDLLVKENVRQFTVATDHLVSVTIGLDTLKQLDTAYAGGDIILRADKVDALRSTEAKATIGTRPTYDLSLVYLSGGKETPIANLNGHIISVRLPYTPAKGEQTGNLYAVYVDDAGKVEWITKSSYNASLKAVVLKPAISAFTAWATKLLSRPLPTLPVTGQQITSSLQPAGDCSPAPATPPFSPDTGMTRGMFVTAWGGWRASTRQLPDREIHRCESRRLLCPLCELGGADRYCGGCYRHYLCTGHQHQPGTDGGDYEKLCCKAGL